MTLSQPKQSGCSLAQCRESLAESVFDYRSSSSFLCVRTTGTPHTQKRANETTANDGSICDGRTGHTLSFALTSIFSKKSTNMTISTISAPAKSFMYLCGGSSSIEEQEESRRFPLGFPQPTLGKTVNIHWSLLHLFGAELL
jgi:hypothetical protein